MGGLARRAGAIDRFRGPESGLLVLDGGDAVLSVPRAAAPISEVELNRALAMLRGMGLMGTDAMGIGEAELMIDGQKLLGQARSSGVPLLCSNLQDKRGRRPFAPRRLLTTGGIRVGVFALYEDAQGISAAEPAGMRVVDAVAAARAEVAALRKEGAELIVMIGHLGMPRAREIAAAVPGIHLGVVGHTGWRTNEPEAVGSRTFLVEAGRRGQVLGHLEVRLGDGWAAEQSLVDDSRRHVLYDEVRREVERTRRAAASVRTAQAWRDQILPQAERAKLLAKQLETARPAAARHTLVARQIELDETVPEHAGVKAMLDAQKAQLAQVPVRAIHRPTVLPIRRPHR